MLFFPSPTYVEARPLIMAVNLFRTRRSVTAAGPPVVPTRCYVLTIVANIARFEGTAGEVVESVGWCLLDEDDRQTTLKVIRLLAQAASLEDVASRFSSKRILVCTK